MGFRNSKMQDETPWLHSRGSKKKGGKSRMLDNDFGDRGPTAIPERPSHRTCPSFVQPGFRDDVRHIGEGSREAERETDAVENPRKEKCGIDAAQILVKEKVGKGKYHHNRTTYCIAPFSADPVDHGRNPGPGENGRKREDSHHNADVQFGAPEV